MGPKLANNPQRTPIPDPLLGQIHAVPPSPPIDEPPKVQKFGLCPKPTYAAEEPTHDGSMMVRSNYVRVTKIPKNLYAYSLKFTRPAGEKSHGRIEYNKRREIRDAFQALIRADAFKLTEKKVAYITDFENLWTTAPINERTEEGYSFTSGEFEYIQQNGRTIPNLRADVSYTEHLAEIEDTLRITPLAELPHHIRALNAAVAKCIEDYQKNTGRAIDRVGANKYYLSNGYVEMDSKLRAVRGYYTSIRPGTHGTLLNINPATSAFLPPITEIKLHNNDIDYNSEAARLKTFIQFGDYDASEQKFYELEDAVSGQPRQTKATDPGTTVHDYFTQKAMVQLPGHTEAETCCVNVGKRVKSNSRSSNETADEIMRKQSARGAQWIPACLLQIIPGQIVTTTLDSGHTRDMIKNALRLPAENFGLIEEEGLEIIGVKGPSNEQTLATLDFNIEKELIEVPAVTLEQPTLHFDKTIVAKKGGSKTDGTKTPELGQWNLQNVRFANTPRSLGKLHMLALEGCLESAANDPLDTAYTTFLAKLAEHGITMGQGTAIHEKDLIAKNPIDAPPFGVEGAIKKFLNKVHTSNSDCSVIVIPEKNYDLYAFTKRLFDFNQRHVLFAVGSKFIEKGAQQFMSNLALKVNMKFGGASHYLSADKLDECLGKGIKNRTIVLGADIGHCGAGGKDGHPSVACVVGSVDNRFMSYPGSMRLQCGGQETIEKEHLRAMVEERLHAWRHAHESKAWPTHMLFYRDGISESQFKQCIEDEISTIKDAYRTMCKQEVNLTFVICGKRHHTRFYAVEKSQTYPLKTSDPTKLNGNLKPGLLITKVVTNPTPFNFFLQSHLALKGTARSAHYHVLEDGMNIGKKKLPELTMMLCYAFGRSTTGVSYAAPAYIADRLCERGRVYLRAWNLDPDMEPKFVMPEETDDNGKHIRVGETEIKEAKTAFAKEISETNALWGNFYNTKVKQEDSFLHGELWLNPWHPILNERNGMFWM